MLKRVLTIPLSAALLLSMGEVSAGPPDHAGKPGHVGPKQENVENVIYLIPDGFSTGYNATYRYYKEDGSPVWDSFLTGMMTTHSNDHRITDSAAAGTAMATGVKTNNGVVGQSPEGEDLKSILEAADEDGKSTGLVANSTITHATPAVFASNVDSRSNQEEIARQCIDDGVVDVILGGGKDYFLPEEEGGKQPERHLIDEAKEKEYQFVENRDQLLDIEEGSILGLFADNAMEPELHREGTNEPSLAEMTSSAIDVLSQNEDGFFLMVEGSQIDWAGHANDAAWAMSDTEAFEEAVMEAIDFADQDGETLVVVVGDHDTGGISLGGENTKSTEIEMLRDVTATGEYMANQLNEDRSNVKEVIQEYANIDITGEEAENIQEYADPVLAINHVISNYAGVGWSSTDHTGEEVPLYAYGPGSELLTGLVDNTDVPKAMAEAMNVDLTQE
ncbi:alkaline phosphatase [Thalassorhabdus alkalitolerans]|uniref:Alkaline phosphatase n=1 Tax=Thalassorhabdus alkalitolerans TaxID=2282697 RepID=A0ABW0YKP9_9BACI